MDNQESGGTDAVKTAAERLAEVSEFLDEIARAGGFGAWVENARL